MTTTTAIHSQTQEVAVSTTTIFRSFVAAQSAAISYLARHAEDGFTPSYLFVDGDGEIRSIHFRTVDDYTTTSVEAA